MWHVNPYRNNYKDMFVETCEDTFMPWQWGSGSFSVFLCRSTLHLYFGHFFFFLQICNYFAPSPGTHFLYPPFSLHRSHTLLLSPLAFLSQQSFMCAGLHCGSQGDRTPPPQHSPPPLLRDLPLQDFFRLERERGVSREWQNHCNSRNLATSEKAFRFSKIRPYSAALWLWNEVTNASW